MEDLRAFVEQVVGNEPFRVEEVLGEGYVRLNVSEAEARQAKQDIRWVEDIVIELLRNARDAHARHIYVATSREGDMRRICVLDDGDGIPQALQERVFEARVTSKLDTFRSDDWGVHGRGMAMFSIRSNATCARIAASGRGLGTSVVVDVDCTSVRERADQSSWPRLEGARHGGRARIATGPHNIQRTVLEFSLAERSLDVFYGSPLEIAALLYTDDPAQLGLRDILSTPDPASSPVCSRLRFAGDASELKQQCVSIGLDISERSAYRILCGAVAPARTALAQACEAQPGRSGPRMPDLAREARGIGFSKDDLDEIALCLADALAPIADRYYVHADIPSIRMSGDELTVSFHLEHID